MNLPRTSELKVARASSVNASVFDFVRRPRWRHWVSCLILLCCAAFALQVVAQSSSPARQLSRRADETTKSELASHLATETDELKREARIDAEKPMVYLDYVCQNDKSVYLRMHNNTVWHIDVITGDLYASRKPIKLRNGINTYAAPNDQEISLHYFIHAWVPHGQKVNLPEIAYPDNGFSNWIASQDSILFSVPAEYLRKDLQVVVKFNYEWQITKQGYSVAGSEHQVSLRGIDLATQHHQPGQQSCNSQPSAVSQQRPRH